MMIKELTKEQEALLPVYRDKWIKIGLCTDPADRPTAEKGIELIYEAEGLKKPKIVWTPSPWASGVARVVMAKKKRAIGAGIGDSIRESSRCSWDSFRDSKCIGANLWNNIRSNLAVSVETSVWDSIGNSVGDCIKASAWDIWGHVGGNVVFNVRDSVRDSIHGQHDVGGLGFYDYLSEVCGLRKETEKLQGLWLLAKSANWALPHTKICWVSERPKILKLNKQGRLHCENGMALAYPDNWGIYALNGIRMPKEYIMTPAAEINPAMVFNEKNIDVRRELLRKVGVERMMSYGKIIEQNDAYTLINMANVFRVRYAPFLLMQNPSIDAKHLEGVSPSCKTIQEALNWRAGNIKMHWKPLVLS